MAMDLLVRLRHVPDDVRRAALEARVSCVAGREGCVIVMVRLGEQTACGAGDSRDEAEREARLAMGHYVWENCA